MVCMWFARGNFDVFPNTYKLARSQFSLSTSVYIIFQIIKNNYLLLEII